MTADDNDKSMNHLKNKSQITIPKDQAWFYTEKWQLKEKEADTDIKEGRLYEAVNLDNLIEELETE